MLVVLHFQIVDSVFGVSGGVDWAKLDTEGTDECGPVVHPSRDFVRVEDGGLEVLESGAVENLVTELSFRNQYKL